jgi:hypothetical protein
LYSNYVLPASISREQLNPCECKLPLCATGIGKATCSAQATGYFQKLRVANSNRELPKAT